MACLTSYYFIPPHSHTAHIVLFVLRVKRVPLVGFVRAAGKMGMEFLSGIRFFEKKVVMGGK